MTDDILSAENDDEALAAEYALGLLSGSEQAAAAARIGTDPAFARAVAQWERQLAPMADAIPPVAPPPHVYKAVSARLFGSARPAWQGWLAGFGAVLGGVAAVLAVVVYLPLAVLDMTPRYQAQIASEDGGLIVQAAYDEVTDRLTLIRAAGAIAPGRAQELWLIPEGAAPVSLGLLSADGEQRVTVPSQLEPLLATALLAISDEPPGGSPTGAPTGAVLAAGPITEL